MDDSSLEYVVVGLVAMLNVAFAFVLGTAASQRLLGGGGSPWAIRTSVELRRWTVAGLIALIAVSSVLAWVQTAVMAETPLIDALGSVGTFLMRTQVGRASAVGFGVLLLALIVAVRSRDGRASLLLLATCAASFAATRSWGGHAAVRGGAALLMTDWVHLLSAGVWAGVAFATAWVVLRPRPLLTLADRKDCRAFVHALSTTATAALALVLATGAVNAWSALAAGSSSALLGSAWTVILLVKLALVVVAVALGGHNRVFGLPRLTADLVGDGFANSGALRAFSAVINVEALVLLAVEIAAAALSTSAPPVAA